MEHISDSNYLYIQVVLIIIILTLTILIIKAIKKKRNDKMMRNIDDEILNTEEMEKTLIPTKIKEPIKPIQWEDLAIEKIQKFQLIPEVNKTDDLEIDSVDDKISILSESDILADVSSIGNNGSILVVDDALVIRKKLSQFLLKNEYSYSTQKDGNHAINYIKYLIKEKRKLPDIIITDLEMPNIDGIELISWIKNNDNVKDIPIMVISSHKNIQPLLMANINGFLQKPFKDEDLQFQIDYLLSNS